MARALDQTDLAVERGVAQADGARAGRPGGLRGGLRGEGHALPARHELRHALQLVEFDHVVRGDALVAQELVDAAAAERAAVIADERLMCEQRAPVVAGHGGRHQQHEGLGHQRAPFQIGRYGKGRANQHGKVDLAGIHQAEQIQRDTRHDARTAMREFAAKLHQRIHQKRGLH